jgi:hypothetical protein
VYRLMIKAHNKTKLKYLCMTCRDDWEKYTGSGVRWKKHLKRNGVDITTEVLYESEDYDDFVNICILTSAELNVALSAEFANIVPESGYGKDGIDTTRGINNLVIWSDYATQEMKNARVAARLPGQIQNHWTKSQNAEDIKNTIGKKSSEWWNNFTLEERRKRTAVLRLGHKIFLEEGGVKYETWKTKISAAQKARFANIPFEVLSEKNRKSRLNISPESAARRKAKIQAVYKSGKHDHLYARFSKEREGTGNPAAKIIYWFGVPYTKKQFKNLVREQNLDRGYVERMIIENDDCYRDFQASSQDYHIVICPHCGRNSAGRKPSPFKRWHFNNCKEK